MSELCVLLIWYPVVYVRTRGESVGAEHPVRKELERVQGAMRRVKEAEAEVQRRLVIDKEAAKRMLQQGEKRRREDEQEE